MNEAEEKKYTYVEKMDFVIPIKKIGLFTRAVLEGIILFYSPKRIIIVTNKHEINLLQKEIEIGVWKVEGCLFEMIDEETFFEEHFGIHMEDLKREYSRYKKDNQHREFGWWYQQFIKLGASSQVKDITEQYVVWDGDLIPLKKWDLSVFNPYTQKTDYYVAILQEQSRSEFNESEYNRCIRHLLGVECARPPVKGTFIMHHMVFHKKYVLEMLNNIIYENKLSYGCWPLYFISLSHSFYRFSEYMLYASYMIKNHKNDFFYYPYKMFGHNGIRFRNTEEIIQSICRFFYKEGEKREKCFSYKEIELYFERQYVILPPCYVQFEHIYYLL